MHTEEERAEVLKELALGKRPVKIAGERYIPVTTIYEWRTQWINDGTLEAFTTEMEAKAVAAMAVDLLKDQFEVWLNDGSKLSPQQIGILYGITTDKVIAFDKLRADKQSDAGALAVRMRELELLEGLASGRLRLPSAEDVHIIEGESHNAD